MTRQVIVSLVSKGRLRKESLNIFKRKKIFIKSEKGERDLIGYGKYKNIPIKFLFQHARECIDALSNNVADISISGKDLLLNTEIEIQKKIKIYKNLNFGHASLKIFCDRNWIDCNSLLDVSEIATEMFKKYKEPMKCGTKYRRIVETFLEEKNVKNVSVILSSGATEVMTRINASSLVADISSSGQTALANNLKEIANIMDSSAVLMVSKKSLQFKEVKQMLKLLSK
tara:strand:+ start:2902 stop:3585 length:684 start_codon:yes stop_codon:yes gene_type:complete